MAKLLWRWLDDCRRDIRHAVRRLIRAPTFTLTAFCRWPSVALPDPSIITELQSRGQVFRTDVDDAACATNPNKIGPDADGEPGGCTNIRIVLKDGTTAQVGVWNGS